MNNHEIVQELNKLTKNLDTIEEELTKLEAIKNTNKKLVKLILTNACFNFTVDMAEGDCHYGDNCPVFNSKHGRCYACKAKEALINYNAQYTS